jgi:Superfamily II DNA/RNA helicases, SNF2 family
MEIPFDIDFDIENVISKRLLKVELYKDREKDEKEKARDEPLKKPLKKKNQFGLYMNEGTSLKKHQVEAIDWLLNKEKVKAENGIRGGILSYTMGLGKTLISLSVIMKDKLPTLVITPKTVLYEWKSNIDTFFGASCPYLIFRKDECPEFDSLTRADFLKYKVILTTYETVMGLAKNTRYWKTSISWMLVRKRLELKTVIIDLSFPLPTMTNIVEAKPYSLVDGIELY